MVVLDSHLDGLFRVVLALDQPGADLQARGKHARGANDHKSPQKEGGREEARTGEEIGAEAGA